MPRYFLHFSPPADASAAEQDLDAVDAENDQAIIREALAALCRIGADLVNDGEAPNHTITIRDEHGDDVASLTLAVAVAVRRRGGRS